MVVVMMEMAKFLASLLIFLFACFLFPSVTEAVSSLNETAVGNVSTLLQAMPIVMIVILAVFPIYYAFKEGG